MQALMLYIQLTIMRRLWDLKDPKKNIRPIEDVILLALCTLCFPSQLNSISEDNNI